MVCWFIEIRFGGIVARETEFGLRAADHRALTDRIHLCLLLFRRMDIVTRHACDTGASMLADLPVALLTLRGVALQACLTKLGRSERSRIRDRTFGTFAFDVLGNVAVALLARHAVLP